MEKWMYGSTWVFSFMPRLLHTCGNIPRYPLDGRLGRSWTDLDDVKNVIFLTQPRLELWTLGCQSRSQSYTDSPSQFMVIWNTRMKMLLTEEWLMRSRKENFVLWWIRQCWEFSPVTKQCVHPRKGASVSAMYEFVPTWSCHINARITAVLYKWYILTQEEIRTSAFLQPLLIRPSGRFQFRINVWELWIIQRVGRISWGLGSSQSLADIGKHKQWNPI
jgi:hypothetical protein